jgi:hypothetical protein
MIYRAIHQYLSKAETFFEYLLNIFLKIPGVKQVVSKITGVVSTKTEIGFLEKRCPK